MNIPPPDGAHWITTPVLAGVLGSVVGLRWSPGITWPERLTNVGIGLGCAIFLTPGAAEWAGITSPKALAALSFAAGMFGLSLSAALADGIRQTKFGDVIASWLIRKPGP